MKQTIQMRAIDSWFFRESRPAEAQGELSSIFPPAIRTLAGAVRSWVGEQWLAVNPGNDWQDYRDNVDSPLRALIGSSVDGDLGPLQFRGVWLNYKGKRLYPAPSLLQYAAAEKKLWRLQLAEQGSWCDIGKNVRLAERPSGAPPGMTTLENTWVDESTLLAIMQGDELSYDEKCFFTLEQLISHESRLGIARDNVRRTVKTGLLYQTQHLRPAPGLTLEIDVEGLPADSKLTTRPQLIRLGGESRGASLQLTGDAQALPVIKPSTERLQQAKGILLSLLTPLWIQQKERYTLPGFRRLEGDTTCWQGEINGIALTLHGAICGKPLREGGWNLAQHQPRSSHSLIPAGSIFFCETPDIGKAIQQLHGQCIGEQTQFGYGHLAIGLWT